MYPNPSTTFSHSDAHGWPERFANVKPGDHLQWLYQGYWYEICVTKFGLRNPLFYDVVGASQQCHPRFAMPDEAANFWIPPPTPEAMSEVTGDGMHHQQAERVKLTMRPKMSCLNMMIPREKQLYDTAAIRGMVEVSLRRKGLPDRRMLIRKTACFGKLRYSEALLLGYPMEKLKLQAHGRYLHDSESPEIIKLNNGEIIDVEMQPLTNVQCSNNVVKTN